MSRRVVPYGVGPSRALARRVAGTLSRGIVPYLRQMGPTVAADAALNTARNIYAGLTAVDQIDRSYNRAYAGLEKIGRGVKRAYDSLPSKGKEKPTKKVIGPMTSSSVARLYRALGRRRYFTGQKRIRNRLRSGFSRYYRLKRPWYSRYL